MGKATKYVCGYDRLGTYQQIQESDLPPGLRWDTPARFKGQMVTVAFASWPRERAEADHGDSYSMRKGPGEAPKFFARMPRLNQPDTRGLLR